MFFAFSSLPILIYRKKFFSVVCPVINIICNVFILPELYIFVAADLLAVCEDMISHIS